MRTLVLGLGNEVLTDDGVGLRAARMVGALAGDKADLVEACIATVDLLPEITGYDRLIVLDAYLSHDDPPGTAVRATPEDLPRGFGYRSFHSMPFREMLDLGIKLGMDMPREISIHGLCVKNASTFGDAFTPEVECVWRLWAEDVAHMEFREELRAARGATPEKKTYQQKAPS
jgi:hydrogenase maturation protease